jgi:NAD(P)-dependent dehydrogenase (short-subunit alcohol dehydrogenase family)
VGQWDVTSASPRNVVVTGASTGIGRATTIALDRAGIRVFAGVRRNEDGEALREAASKRVTPLLLDVTDSAAVEVAAKSIATDVGDAGLQGLVNNAGIAVAGVLEFVELDDLRRQFEVNLFGLFSVTRALMPLIRLGGGRIVNVSSNGGYVAAPFLGPYSASKFALEGASDSLRRELRSFGISVSIVEPGSIQTEIWDKGRSESERVQAALPEEGKALYAPAFAAMDRYVDTTAGRAIPASKVANAIEHALTAARPRTRYRVGPDAKLMRFLSSVLPDRWLDAFISKMVGFQ